MRFAERDKIRYETVSPFLKGTGIELGAGAYPQELPDGARASIYDLRDDSELGELFKTRLDYKVNSIDKVTSDFPDGADFLIAHNVLEHVPNPIGTLMEWHEHVRDGGIVAISLPDKNACPDGSRLEPPFSHLIYDHLFGRGYDAFESKEHLLSFALSWLGMSEPPDKSSIESIVAWVLSQPYERKPDVHWHAFTQSLTEKTILASCDFQGYSAELLEKVDFTTTKKRSLGDIIVVYRIHRTKGSNKGFRYSARRDFASIWRQLETARDQVAKAIKSGSENVVENASDESVIGHLYPTWIQPDDIPEEIDLTPPYIPESGNCWLSKVVARSPGDTPADSTGSDYRLFEDDRPLGPPHSAHDTIRNQGGGGYSHWYNAIYFSTSDNSNPNCNGRKYTLRIR